MAKKTNNTIALEVLCGKWGSGSARKKNLTKAGYNYDAVQKIVNERMKKKPIDTVAREVIDGLWGSGDTRKKCLVTAGYDYYAVQNRVNELLNPHEYGGTLPTTKLVKSNEQVITDALKFGKWIAGDNRFGYGRKGGSKYKDTKEYSITHSGGCHFCGTNASKINRAKKAGLSNPEEWEYTYVCNTFTHACFAHAGVAAMLKASNHSWWIEDYQKSKDWKEIKKPSKITDLKPGDVFGSDKHFCFYIGNGKGMEATSGPGGGNPASSKEAWAKSIRICDFSTRFKEATHIFRYVGTVNTTAFIRYGEVSYRVILWQEFLNWWSDGKFFEECGEADGIFGDNTLKWTKLFQEKEIGKGEGDGIIGDKTITAASKAKK